MEHASSSDTDNGEANTEISEDTSTEMDCVIVNPSDVSSNLVCYDVSSNSDDETENVESIIIKDEPPDDSEGEMESSTVSPSPQPSSNGLSDDTTELVLLHEEETSTPDPETVCNAKLLKNYRQKKPIGISSDNDDDSTDSSSDESSTSSDSSSVEQAPQEVQKINKPILNNKKKKKSKESFFEDEIELPPIEDLQISVKEEEAQAIGYILHIVGGKQVVVQSYPSTPIIDLDSILFLESGKRALGIVFDVFGSIYKPLYVVRFNSAEHIKEKNIVKGALVYFAPQTEHTLYVILEDLMKNKGSDASWKNNAEPPPHLIEYSDDEEERQAKQARKQKKIKERNMDSKGSEFESNRKTPRIQQNNPFTSPNCNRERNYRKAFTPHYERKFNKVENNSKIDFQRKHSNSVPFRSNRPTNSFVKFGGPPRFRTLLSTPLPSFSNTPSLTQQNSSFYSQNLPIGSPNRFSTPPPSFVIDQSNQFPQGSSHLSSDSVQISSVIHTGLSPSPVVIQTTPNTLRHPYLNRRSPSPQLNIRLPPPNLNQQPPHLQLNQRLPPQLNQLPPPSQLMQLPPPSQLNQRPPPSRLNQQTHPPQLNQRPPPQLNQRPPSPHLNQHPPPPHLNQHPPPPHLNQHHPPPHLNQHYPPPHLNQHHPPPHLNQHHPSPQFNQGPHSLLNKQEPSLPQFTRGPSPIVLNQGPPTHINQEPALQMRLNPSQLNQMLHPSQTNQMPPSPQLNQFPPPSHLSQSLPPPQLNHSLPPPQLNHSLPPPQLNRSLPPPDLNRSLLPPDLNRSLLPPQLNHNFPPPHLNHNLLSPQLNPQLSPFHQGPTRAQPIQGTCPPQLNYGTPTTQSNRGPPPYQSNQVALFQPFNKVHHPPSQFDHGL